MNDLKSKLETLLFISHKPIAIAEASKIVEADKQLVTEALRELSEEYQQRQGGISIIFLEDKYQMVTASDNAEISAKFLKTEIAGELTKPALETLTIIAYRGPISKTELELIRGVNCSLILRNLLLRGLVEAREDKDRLTAVYQITFDFLRHLGLNSTSELPNFEKLNRNNNLDKLLNRSIEKSANSNDGLIDDTDLPLQASDFLDVNNVLVDNNEKLSNKE